MHFPSDPISMPAVAEATQRAFSGMFAGAHPRLLDKLFADVEAMFSGGYLDYGAIDTPYHDLEHTLRVTVCFVAILQSRHEAQVEPRLDPRRFELGVAAALLHDTGYLKLRSDASGTGAKYTFTHVLRSCSVASSYLPSVGVALGELDGVLGAIRCTNPTTPIRRLHFAQPIEGVIGCAVATADYLGQMAAPNYLDDLPALFEEFEESDRFSGVPLEQRAFRSIDDLIAQTPGFWRNTVLPRLDNELLGLYRFLAVPFPDGPNPYLQAITANIGAISAEARRLFTRPSH